MSLLKPKLNLKSSVKKQLVCQLKACAKEHAASLAETNITMQKMKHLVNDMAAKKITLAQFKAELIEVKKHAFTTPTTKALAACSIEHCLPELQQMLALTANFLKKDQADKIHALLAKKPFTVDTYMRIMTLMTSAV